MRLEFWQGDAGDDWCTVVVWSDTAGVVEITTNRGTQTITIDPAVRFGVDKVVVTGIGDRAAVEVAHSGGERITGSLRTMPKATDTWYMAFASCIQAARPNYWPYLLLDDYDVRMVWFQDDMPYSDGSQQNNARWQEGSAQGGYLGWSSDGASAWWDTYPAFLSQFGIRDLMRAVPTYMTFGDHAVGDNWDHASDHAGGSSLFTPALSTQTEVDSVWSMAMEAWDAFAYGNPSPTQDSEAASYKPSNAAAGASIDEYPVRYWRKTVGPVEFFTVDTLSHKCPVSKAEPGTLISADAGAKTMVGLPQFNWLKARVPASAAQFKALMSGQCFYNISSASQGDFVEYQTERDHLSGYLAANADGLLVLSGDTHAPIVAMGDFLSVCSGAAGQGVIGNGTGYWADGPADNTWRPFGPNLPTEDQSRNTIGLMKITPEYLEPMILSVEGDVLYKGARIVPGSNTPAPASDAFGF